MKVKFGQLPEWKDINLFNEEKSVLRKYLRSAIQVNPRPLQTKISLRLKNQGT
jgi:hypothetical protein